MDSVRSLVYLNPRDLLPSRLNVRSSPGDLAGLAETIREHGILQPLAVAQEGDDYRVVYGNRRREAAIVVGLDRVPCMVIEATDDDEVVIQQMLENLQRLDLNDLDKSRAFERLLKQVTDRGYGQSEALDAMARTLGLSVRQLQRYLRLRQLVPEVQQLIAQGDLGVTHGQHLVDLSPAGRQEDVARLTVEESLSAAELSRLCTVLQHNANIDPVIALGMMRRGERVAAVEERAREKLTRLSTGGLIDQSGAGGAEAEDSADGAATPTGGASPSRGSGSDDRAWDDSSRNHLEPTTLDGNRVRKLHSIDSFVDEVQRLAQCVQDGDLKRFLAEDDTGQLKMRLATRQLRFLVDTIASLLDAAD